MGQQVGQPVGQQVGQQAAPGRSEPQAGARTALWAALLLALGLGWAVFAMQGDLDGDFRRGWRGHNGARYAQIARNYARDGFLFQGAAPRFDAAGADGSSPAIYAHHPPGVTLLVGAAFVALGESERVARGVSLVASMLGLLALFALVARVAGAGTAGGTVLLTVALPMTVVYGTHVEVQGPHVLAVGLVFLWAYDRWRCGASAGPVLVLAALASAFDWFGLYFVAGCALHAALARPRSRRTALILAGTCAGLFAFWVLWLGSLPGMSPTGVFRAASVRVDGGQGALAADQPGLGQALLGRLQDLSQLLPGFPVVLVLALVLLMHPVWSDLTHAGQRPARPLGLSTRWLLGLLLAPPLLHCALFPAGLAVHDYWLFALPPALGLTAALLLGRLPAGWSAAGAVALALAAMGWGAGAGSAEDALPALVGRALGQQVPVGEVVLTNYAANPLRFGAEGDEHHVRLPEVTYYSDRVVRGGIGSAEQLREALRRRPDARWFLLAPFPPPREPEGLELVLREVSPHPPTVLSEQPPVLLYRLRP